MSDDGPRHGVSSVTAARVMRTAMTRPLAGMTAVVFGCGRPGCRYAGAIEQWAVCANPDSLSEALYEVEHFPVRRDA